MSGKRRQAGIEHFARSADVCAKCSAIACALAQAVRTRGKSVRMPRVSSHASNGPSTPPNCARRDLTRCHSAESSRVVSVPAITSEWPFRYFVAECMTMSAPSSSGRVSTGVAAVESTATDAPAACAISQLAAMSVIDHSGLAGVSIQTSRVRPGCTARRTSSVSVMSMNSTRSPHCVAKFMSQLRSDQYITFGAST